jgi:hypothetical protein
MNFAFISRHEPTQEQAALAAHEGIALTHVGDADAFSVTEGWVFDKGPFEGVVVVHPAAAMRLCSTFVVGVFENENRAGLGEKPEFFAKSFQLYDMRD